MVYPHVPGYARNSTTSKEAAEQMDTYKDLHNYILMVLKQIGDYGHTVDELRQQCEDYFSRSFDRSTIAARFTELEAQFKIKRTDETRLTPRSRRAYVYVWHDGTPYEIKLSKRDQIKDNLQTVANFIDALVKGKKITDGAFANRAPEIYQLQIDTLKEFE